MSCLGQALSLALGYKCRVNFVCEQTMQSTLRRPHVLFSALTLLS